MDLRVWVAGFPVQMTVVTMVTVVTVVNMVTVVTVVIMVTVVLSTHPKVMHQILQLWQEKKTVSALSALSSSLVVPSSKSRG